MRQVRKSIKLLLVVAILPLIDGCDAVGKVVGSDDEGGESGSMYGTVMLEGRTDHSGATVWLKEAPSYRATTNSSGYYQIDNIPEGKYTPMATAPGYEVKEWDRQIDIPQPNPIVDFGYLKRI